MVLLCAVSCSKYERLDIPKDTPECIVDYIFKNRKENCFGNVLRNYVNINHGSEIEELEIYIIEWGYKRYAFQLDVFDAQCNIVCSKGESICMSDVDIYKNAEIIWER